MIFGSLVSVLFLPCTTAIPSLCLIISILLYQQECICDGNISIRTEKRKGLKMDPALEHL